MERKEKANSGNIIPNNIIILTILSCTYVLPFIMLAALVSMASTGNLFRLAAIHTSSCCAFSSWKQMENEKDQQHRCNFKIHKMCTEYAQVGCVNWESTFVESVIWQVASNLLLFFCFFFMKYETRTYRTTSFCVDRGTSNGAKSGGATAQNAVGN